MFCLKNTKNTILEWNQRYLQISNKAQENPAFMKGAQYFEKGLT